VAAIKKNFKNNNLVDRHVAPLGHIIPILSQPACTFTPYLEEKQQIPIALTLV
jgi:hypothetical protein